MIVGPEKYGPTIRSVLVLPVLLAALVILGLGLLSPPSQAATLQLSDAAIYIEINDTDGDAGVQVFLDGEGWDSMEVFAPDQTRILAVHTSGSIGLQGITELFLESAEPS